MRLRLHERYPFLMFVTDDGADLGAGGGNNGTDAAANSHIHVARAR